MNEKVSLKADDQRPSFEAWCKEFNFGGLYSKDAAKHYDSLEEAQQEELVNILKKAQSNVQCNNSVEWPTHTPVQQ